MGKYNRTYWRKWPTTIAVFDRQETGSKISTKRFKKVFRYFLVRNFLDNEVFLREAELMKTEDIAFYKEQEGTAGRPKRASFFDGLTRYQDIVLILANLYHVLKIRKAFGIRVTEIEKEFFYLRCLKLQVTPQVILRIFLRLSKEEYNNEVWNFYEISYQDGNKSDIWYFLNRIHVNISPTTFVLDGPVQDPVHGDTHVEVELPAPDAEELEALAKQKEFENTYKLFVMEEKISCKACGQICEAGQSACTSCIAFAQFVLEN